MFDIGFWELVVIGVVSLIVIGPERLPGLARTAGLWMGKARRMVASVKADIEQEIKADELREIMKKQAESTGLHEIIEETRSTLSDIATDTDLGTQGLDSPYGSESGESGKKAGSPTGAPQAPAAQTAQIAQATQAASSPATGQKVDVADPQPTAPVPKAHDDSHG